MSRRVSRSAGDFLSKFRQRKYYKDIDNLKKYHYEIIDDVSSSFLEHEPKEYLRRKLIFKLGNSFSKTIIGHSFKSFAINLSGFFLDIWFKKK